VMPNGSSEICMEYARLLDGWLSSGEMLRVEGDMVRHGLARCGECGGVHLVGDLVPVYSSEVVRGGRRVEQAPVGPILLGQCARTVLHIVIRLMSVMLLTWIVMVMRLRYRCGICIMLMTTVISEGV
jgi:hypothetical protein